MDCSAIESLLNLQPVTPDGLHLINPTWTSELTVVEIDETSGYYINNVSHIYINWLCILPGHIPVLINPALQAELCMYIVP